MTAIACEHRAERSWRAGTRGGGYAVKSVGSSFTCVLGRLANASRHAVSMPLLFAECHIGIIMHCAPAVQHVLQYVSADVEAHEKPKSILRAALSGLLAGHGEVAAPRAMGVTTAGHRLRMAAWAGLGLPRCRRHCGVQRLGDRLRHTRIGGAVMLRLPHPPREIPRG